MLKKQAPETSIEFADSVMRAEDNYNLDYQIKPGVAAQDYKDPNGRVVIAKGEKITGHRNSPTPPHRPRRTRQ